MPYTGEQMRVMASKKIPGKDTVWMRMGTAWLRRDPRKGDRIEVKLWAMPVYPEWDGSFVLFPDDGRDG